MIEHYSRDATLDERDFCLDTSLQVRDHFLNVRAGVLMSQFFYVQDGQRKGPVGFADLKQMYTASEISAKTLIWSQGYGDEWKELHKAEGFRSDDEPPLVPDHAVTNHWLYWLIAAPIISTVIEFYALNADPNMNDELPLTAFIFIGINIFFAMKDNSALRKAGREIASLGVLAVLFVPAYVYVRANRTGLGMAPFAAYAASFLFSAFILPEYLY